MKHARLDLARSAELLPPLDGTIAVFGAIERDRLQGLQAADLRCVSSSFVVNKAIGASGIQITPDLSETTAHAVVFLPRAKAEAWHLIALAVQNAPDGWIVVDGQKSDGIESVAKQITRVVGQTASYSKAHGKTIWFRAEHAQELINGLGVRSKNKAGFQTAPGVFSADDVDPASHLLMEHVPTDLSGVIADFGAGWGYLAARLLDRNTGVKALHLIEDNSASLECARANVGDERAVFHWADALSWTPAKPLDAIIMNPPFHTSRNAEPTLGINFISTAAWGLRVGGKLYMVANRHLPYEPALEQSFDKFELLVRTNRFKVFCATRGRGKSN